MGGGGGLVYVMRRPDRVRSICAVFPTTDFTQWSQESAGAGYIDGIAKAHGVAATDVAPVLQSLSAMQHTASFADIPVLLIHGDADLIVPVHHSRDFAAALKKQGSMVIYHEIQGVGHDSVIAKPFQLEIADFLTDTAGPGTNKSFKSSN